METRKRILIVDDNRLDLIMATEFLKNDYGDSIIIETTTDIHQAITKLETNFYKLLIFDFHMPAMHGLKLAEIAAVLQPTTPKLILTGNLMDMPNLDTSKVDQILEKPLKPADIKKYLVN